MTTLGKPTITLGAPQHACVVLCWAIGFELLCPDPGHEEAWVYAEDLAKRGEGLHSFAFGVADLDESVSRAKSAGFSVAYYMEDSRHPNAKNAPANMTFLGDELKRPFKMVREAALDPFNSITMALFQAEPKDSV